MLTLLPPDLHSLIDKALVVMTTDPHHRLAPQRRREIYDTLRALPGLIGPHTCGWLAVITAQRVLPLFQQEFPEDTLPQDLLNTAIGLLEGKVDNQWC